MGLVQVIGKVRPDEIYNLAEHSPILAKTTLSSDLPQTQEEMFESEARYTKAYLKHPLLTDWRYFWKAFYQIVF